MTPLQAINKELFEQFVQWLPDFCASVLIFVLFYLAAQITKRLVSRMGRKADPQKAQVIELIATTSKIVIILMGLISALGSMGINVSALVAGLGLSGFALSFAFKDALSNLLAGILIFTYRPFRIGDTIILAGHEGLVVSLTLRFITLQAQGKKVLIPNGNMLVNSITLLEHPTQENVS